MAIIYYYLSQSRNLKWPVYNTVSDILNGKARSWLFIFLKWIINIFQMNDYNNVFFSHLQFYSIDGYEIPLCLNFKISISVACSLCILCALNLKLSVKNVSIKIFTDHISILYVSFEEILGAIYTLTLGLGVESRFMLVFS